MNPSTPNDLSKETEKDLADLDVSASVDEVEGRGLPEEIAALSEAEYNLVVKKIVRKADCVIMPIMGVLYILNYIDRQNLAAAKLQGIMEDLNMSDQDFATAISILFVGYLPFQLPSNLIISRITRPGLYICCACMIWGSISACTAAVNTYSALLVVRVILGISEAVFFPGAIYLLSAWYSKHELGVRIAGLYLFQQFGNAFGGLIAAGLLKLDGTHGIAGWKWLFIVEGTATVGIGAICCFFLPEYPYNAKLLAPLERQVAVHRLEKEAGAGEGTEDIGTWQGFKIGLKDAKVYIMIFCNMMSQAQGSIANFFPSIVRTLGYNTTITLLLTAPPYVFAAIYYFGLTYYSDKKNHMYWFMMFCIALACCTYVLPMATLNVGARYFGMMLMPCASVGPQLLMYKTINHHMPRPIAKRAAAIAMLNAIGGTSNIWASYLYYAPPRYFAAFGCLIACACLFACVLTGYKYYVRYLNRLLDGTPEDVQKAMKKGVTKEMVELGFRFEGY